jgi:hypothetical protein
VLLKVLLIIARPAKAASPLGQQVSTGPQGKERKESTELEKLRRKFLFMILAMETVGFVTVLGITGTFLLDFLRRRTWLLHSTIGLGGAILGHLVLWLTPSMTKTRSSSGPSSGSSAGPKTVVGSRTKRLLAACIKISPATNTANMLAHPVAVLVRSQLNAAQKIKNKELFVPPTERPRAEHLKVAATLLQNNMFLHGENTMNGAVADVIEDEFVPAARVHFEECTHQARSMVPEIRLRYHFVRKGHLAIYTETLEQIRRENTFPDLQRRSDKLTERCRALGRPYLQKATRVCDLYRGAEAVQIRYDNLMAMVASKTGTSFHAVLMKGMLRICEKMAMSPEWSSSAVLDVVRGAIECPNFSMMISLLRLLKSIPLSLFRTLSLPLSLSLTLKIAPRSGPGAEGDGSRRRYHGSHLHRSLQRALRTSDERWLG